MKPHDEPGTLLKKAREDLDALDAMIGSSKISEGIFGFLCQQAVEKSLKALLSKRGETYRWTHDLQELVDQAGESGIEVPEAVKNLIYLTAFAAEFRYDDVSDDLMLGNRVELLASVRQCVEWAGTQVL